MFEMMKTPARPKRAPNQLSPEREEQLINTAKEVFFEKGVGQATIDLVAKRARVTKVTIYKRYKNKYELFEAVVQYMASLYSKQLSALGLDASNPVDGLRRAAKVIRGFFNSEDHREYARLIIAETPRHPELCLRARNKMVSAASQELREFFEILIDRGQMECDYPREAAISFVLLFQGGFRPLLNALGTEEEQNRQFEADFAMFIKGNGIALH